MSATPEQVPAPGYEGVFTVQTDGTPENTRIVGPDGTGMSGVMAFEWRLAHGEPFAEVLIHQEGHQEPVRFRAMVRIEPAPPPPPAWV